MPEYFTEPSCCLFVGQQEKGGSEKKKKNEQIQNRPELQPGEPPKSAAESHFLGIIDLCMKESRCCFVFIFGYDGSVSTATTVLT